MRQAFLRIAISGLAALVVATLQPGEAAAGTEGTGAIVIVPLESPPLTFGPDIDAEQAQALLLQAGVASVRLSDQVRPVPGIEQREWTITMHNWYQPIAPWYGMTRTPFSYTAPEVSPGERVLEVTLSNFELGPGRVLYVLVSSKLADPGSGRVISKARKMVCPETADARTPFSGDASAFKRTFAAAGRDALRSNLRSMDLLPE